VANATAEIQGTSDALMGTLAIQNRDSLPCDLTGRPSLALRDADGRLLVLEEDVLDLGSAPDTAIVAPGVTAAAPFRWANWCAGSPSPPLTLVITFPANGGALDVSLPTARGARQDDSPGCEAPAAPSTLAVGAFAVRRDDARAPAQGLLIPAT
jgi:hypothetical protein